MAERKNSIERQGTESVWPHRIALLTALSTFPLLFIGGLVTSKGAGLAVPDWPTTFGHNMFLYPWSKMVGGIFYEHSHRLVASGVGFLTLALAFSVWLHERRSWVRWLGLIAVALVITQGIIGGLRVVLLEWVLAIIHACLAQAFFALTVSLVFFTSREWKEPPERIKPQGVDRTSRLSLVTTIMIYLQGAFGAVLRYTGALLNLHLLFAVLVALHVILLGGRMVRFCSDHEKLFRPFVLLSGLLFLQLALGLASYLVRYTSFGLILPLPFVEVLRTVHVVTGALMLVSSLVVTLRSYRLSSLSELPVSQDLQAEGASA